MDELVTIGVADGEDRLDIVDLAPADHVVDVQCHVPDSPR